MKIKDNRNGTSIFVNLVAGYGLYTVLTYFQIRKRFIIVCLLFAVILSVICSCLVMNRKCFGTYPRKRVVCVLSISQKMIGIGLAFIMAVSGINILFGSTIMKSKTTPLIQTNTDGQSLSDNIETVSLLREDTWKLLTVQERLDVLQIVADVEQRYLGLPNELNVGAANLSKNTLGYYSDKTHEIVISLDSLLLESPQNVLDTVCHEAYHCYQHRMVEVLNNIDEHNKNLKMLRKANSYALEFKNYNNGEEDFCSYYYQECESDARDYAEDAVCDYYRRIDEYLTEFKE